MFGVLLADDEQLKTLLPDPGWDVQGVRDVAGGVMAVGLVVAVGLIVAGCLAMLPGLITGNMMERAFSWKALAAALLVPLTIGAASAGWAWSVTGYGSDGLQPSANYSAQARKVGGMTSSAGSDSSDSSGTIGDAWNWVTGGDGKGNVLQKAGKLVGDEWNWLTGGDGKGNVFQKVGSLFR